MKRERAPIKPITYKNVLFYLGLFALFGCSCPFGEQFASGSAQRDKAIFAEGLPALMATGESVTVTVRTRRLAGEQAGQTVTVTPRVSTGATVTPATRQLALAEEGFATTTFEVRSAAGYSVLQFDVKRSDHSIESQKSLFEATPITSEAVPTLVSVTYDPTIIVMNRGTSASLNVRVLPRGNVSGPVLVRMDHNISGITLSPTTFVVNLTQGATTPVTHLVTVSAAANAFVGTNILRSEVTWSQSAYEVGRVPITINGGTGTPSFTFTATPSQVTSALYQESAPVTYTITSVNGFTGDVVVSQEADGEVGISPTTSPETFTVSPGTPTTFTRRFTRYYSTDDIHVTFTASHAPTSTSRQVVTTVVNP